MKLILFTLLAFNVQAKELAVDIEIIDETTTRVIITDFCNEEHSLVMDNKDLNKGIFLKWVENLHKAEKINKCIDSL